MDRRHLLQHSLWSHSIWYGLALVMLYGIALWLGYVYILDMMHIKESAGRRDWYIFSDQALDYLNTGRLYQDDLVLYAPSAAIYKFPPFFDAVLIFLYDHGISPDVVKRYVISLHFILLAFSAVLLLSSGIRNYLPNALLLIFIFISGAFENNLNSLQLEIYLLFLISAAIFFLRRNHFLWGGSMMGIAAGIKVYPIFFCFGAIVKDIRVIYGVLSGITVTVLLSMTVVFPAEHYHYFFRILPYLFFENIGLITDNTSLGFLLVALFGFKEKYALLFSSAIFYGTISLVFFNALLKIKMRDFSVSNSSKFDVMLAEISLLVAVFLLASKNIWMSYQLLTIIPVFGLVTLSWRSRKTIFAGAVTFVFMCFLMHNWRYYEVDFIKSLMAYVFVNVGFVETVFFFPYFRSFANIVIYGYVLFLYFRVTGDYCRGVNRVQDLRRD